tara:strand:- start:421 stop:1218 length:798 start_codon:yes stop_codon:yes gene_type:complete
MAELYVNVGGTWKTASNYYVNVNGTWKEGSELHAKVSSDWKESGGTTPSLITTNLVLHLDASNSSSYGGSGTTWTDLSGQGNHGTLTNGPTYNSDDGGSIVFDGSDDVVSVPDDSSLQISANITIAGWIKPSGFGGNDWGRIIDKSGSYLFFLDDTNTYATDGIDWWPYTGSALRIDNVVTLNEWAYFTIVASGSNVVIYKNGSSIGSASNLTSLPSSSNTSYIGNRSDGNRGFEGKIAQIHMYNSALSASEVLQNYNATKSNYV